MAVDLIAILIPETHVKEGTGFTATAYCRNRETAAAATPTSLKYRLDCLTSGNEILDWATLAAASSASIAITGAQNAIQLGSNPTERKQLTVMTDEGLATQYRETKTWVVENVYGVP